MPHKYNADRRHRMPKRRDKVTNWQDYEAGLRQRGSLTIWFTEEAIAAWRAVPRTTPGGQARYSDLAIETSLILRTVFHQPLRQTEGLVGSILHRLGVELAVPDHSTLSRRARTLRLPPEPGSAGGAVERLVDSTGVKLCGPGEWLVEKHGAQRRRAWKKLHVGLDAATGRVVAATLTDHDVDDGSQVGPLLEQIDEPLACLVADGAYDQTGVTEAVVEHTPDAAVIVPPRSTAVPSANAKTNPTQRDQHLQFIAEHGRMAWQKAFRYNVRALVEAFFSRWKRVIGDALRFRTEERRNIEIAIAIRILNHMLDLGRPDSVRVA